MKDAAESNKQKKDRQAELETCIKTLTQLYTRHPSLGTRHELEVTKMGLTTLFTSKAEYALQRLKGRHYEQGEKAGRLLAPQLRQQEAVLAIPALQSTTGEILTCPQDIVDEFASFYETLYMLEAQANPIHIDGFLARVQLSSFTEEGRKLIKHAPSTFIY